MHNAPAVVVPTTIPSDSAITSMGSASSELSQTFNSLRFSKHSHQFSGAKHSHHFYQFWGAKHSRQLWDAKHSHHFCQFWGAKHSRRFWVPNTAIASSSSGVPNTAIGFTSSGMSNDSALGFTSSEINITKTLPSDPSTTAEGSEVCIVSPLESATVTKPPAASIQEFLNTVHCNYEVVNITTRSSNLPYVCFHYMVVTAICSESHYFS